MIALPAPYGYPHGLSVSIVAPRDQHDAIAAVTARYGCPPFVAKRVSAAIAGSGRYDCFVQAKVARLFTPFAAEIAALGGNANARETDSKEWRDHVIYRRTIAQPWRPDRSKAA